MLRGSVTTSSLTAFEPFDISLELGLEVGEELFEIFIIALKQGAAGMNQYRVLASPDLRSRW